MSSEGALDLPKNVVKRIVKERLAADGAAAAGAKGEVQLNKEALLAFCESAKVFLSYLTATANDVCKEKKRATVSGDDVLAALEDLDFQELLPQLREAYEAYKQSSKEKKEKKAEVTRKRKSAAQDAQDGGDAQQPDAAAADDKEGGAAAAAAAAADAAAGAAAEAGGVEGAVAEAGGAGEQQQGDPDDAEMADAQAQGADDAPQEP